MTPSSPAVRELLEAMVWMQADDEAEARIKAVIAELEAANKACAKKTELLRAVLKSMDSDFPFPPRDKITEAINL